jgi:hypothetical protein
MWMPKYTVKLLLIWKHPETNLNYDLVYCEVGKGLMLISYQQGYRKHCIIFFSTNR